MKALFFMALLMVGLSAKEFVFGVVPQQGPLELSKKWTQVADYLSKQTGYHIIFKTENSIPAFEQKLYTGKYDFAYMNPFHFIVANEKIGYEAQVRGNKMLTGIIVSTQKELNPKELKGKTFLFPAPNAFAATLLTKFEFKYKYNFDIDKDAKVMYVNSHDSVYKGIARGIGDFGGAITRTYENFKDDADKSKLNIIYKTDSYPSHPIAFHPDMNPAEVTKIQEAFIKMPKELASIFSIDAFVKTTNKEFDSIKKFNK